MNTMSALKFVREDDSDVYVASPRPGLSYEITHHRDGAWEVRVMRPTADFLRMPENFGNDLSAFPNDYRTLTQAKAACQEHYAASNNQV